LIPNLPSHQRQISGAENKVGSGKKELSVESTSSKLKSTLLKLNQFKRRLLFIDTERLTGGNRT
jgi:hypothetical protein